MRMDSAAVREHAGTAALVLVLLVAAWFRLSGADWDEGAHLHPDERYIASVSNVIDFPWSPVTYLDVDESPLSPYNTPEGRAFPYGTLPIFATKAVAELVGRGDYDHLYLVGRWLGARARPRDDGARVPDRTRAAVEEPRTASRVPGRPSRRGALRAHRRGDPGGALLHDRRLARLLQHPGRLPRPLRAPFVVVDAWPRDRAGRGHGRPASALPSRARRAACSWSGSSWVRWRARPPSTRSRRRDGTQQLACCATACSRS